MRIGITGATGLVGSALMGKIGLQPALSGIPLHRVAFQQEPEIYLKKQAHLNNLDCVIHCAANTNVDACEEMPEKSLKDNFLFSRDIGQACALLGIKLIYLSSTGVYGSGSQAPYVESDTPYPTTVHHKHKLMAEKAILESSSNALVLRTGWLFGGDIQNPKNFVANRLREILTCDGELNSDISQIGNPTFVDDLADHIITLAQVEENGIFNCVNPEPASRFDYVKEILRASGRNVKLHPVDGSKFQRRAKTSPNESAKNQRLSNLGLNNMPPWRQRLSEYVPHILSSVKNEI